MYIYISIMELNYKSAKWRGKAINVQVVIWQNNDIKYDVLLTLLLGNWIIDSILTFYPVRQLSIKRWIKSIYEYYISNIQSSNGKE